MLDNENLHKYKDLKNLKNFLKKKIVKRKDDFIKSLRNYDKYTMSGIEKKIKDINKMNTVNLKWRDNARVKWIDFLIKSQISK